jgi:hypothetical protein
MKNVMLPVMGVVVVGAVVLTGRAGAAIVQYEANLDGLQVVAPNASPAFGLAQFDFDTTTSMLTVTTGTFQDLLGGSMSPLTLQGPAGPGVNAGTIWTMTLDTPGAMTGTFSGSVVLTAPQVTSLQSELTYVLIRSSVFPGGEIRGQVMQVPAPGAVCAAVLGLAGVAGRRRR